MRSFYDFATFRSLRHRNFRLLVEGNVISSSGDFMQSIAQSWLVWQLTRSPFLLGLVSFFDTVPRLFLVTRGVQSVGGNVTSVAHSPLWGLGATLPYELPEFLVVAVDSGSDAYLDWVLSQTQHA